MSHQPQRDTTWTYSRRLFAILTLLIGLGIVALPAVLAQAVESPFLEITGINTEDFPEIAITVYGEGIDGSLGGAAITIIEDGVPQEIAKSETILLGTQTLLALDASASLLQEPQTQSAIAQTITNMINGYLTTDRDWLSFFAYTHSESSVDPQLFSTWQRTDYQQVLTAFTDYQPTEPQPVTPLYDLLRASIVYFDDATVAPANLTRAIVLFSDGSNPLTTAAKEELYRFALEKRVRIHVVQVGDVPDAEQHLSNLAQSTNGRYVRLDLANPQLNNLWQIIQGTQVQRMLTYRTSRPSPQQVSVRTMGGTRQLDDTAGVPTVSVAPPQVNVVEPTAANFNRTLPGGQTPEFDTPLEELVPNVLDVVVDVTWPDERPRALSQLEYTFGAQPIIFNTEPFTAVSLPIDELDRGEYTLRVRATDELGLVSEYAIKPLTIAIERLPVPEPPELAIVQPDFAELERTVADIRYNTPATDLEPQTVNVAVELRWPNEQPRDLARVEYTIGEQTVTQEQEPFTEAVIPIDTLDDGEYTVYVRATDVRGLYGEATQSLTIVINRPPAPPPPVVTILEPTAAQLIRRLPAGSTDETAALADLEPNLLPVAIDLNWPPDGQPRPLKQVEYTLGDATVVQTAEPFTTISLPIGLLDAGEYMLQVRVIDQDDLIGEVEQPITLRIDRSLPGGMPSWLIVLLLVIIAAAIYLWYDASTREQVNGYLQRGRAALDQRAPAVGKTLDKVTPVVRKQVTNLATGVGTLAGNLQQRIRTMSASKPTPPTRPPVKTNMPSSTAPVDALLSDTMPVDTMPVETTQIGYIQPIVAKLVYLDSGQPAQTDLELTATDVRIGRDPALVRHVVTDPRVSRLHCRIARTDDGEWHLWDEGSAAGTHVQGKRVDMAGQVLQSGDIIGIGPVRYRFERAEDMPSAEERGFMEPEPTLIGHIPDLYDGQDEDDGAAPPAVYTAPAQPDDDPKPDDAVHVTDEDRDNAHGNADGNATAGPQFVQDRGSETVTPDPEDK